MALAGLVEKFEQQFVVVATRIIEEEKVKDRSSPVIVAEAAGGWSVVSQPGLGITRRAAAHLCPHSPVALAVAASGLASIRRLRSGCSGRGRGRCSAFSSIIPCSEERVRWVGIKGGFFCVFFFQVSAAVFLFFSFLSLSLSLSHFI